MDFPSAKTPPQPNDETARHIPMPADHRHKNCPHCNWVLAFAGLKLDIFPYLHADLFLKCIKCKREWTFGIPFEHEAGMAQYIFGNDYRSAADAFENHEPPTCPFHHILMSATKFIFYDPKRAPILQYKCPKCYLCRHIPIGQPTNEADPADALVTERLRQLGYLE